MAKVIVVGGGPSGIMAAISAAKQKPQCNFNRKKRIFRKEA